MTAILRKDLLILLLAVVCPMLVAGQNCNVQQLEGTYIYVTTGYAYVFPWTGLGTVQANHQGVLINKGVLVNTGAGGPTTFESTGSWTVGPDCKITVTMENGQVYSGFAVNNGQEIHMLLVGPTPLQVPGPPFPPMPLLSSSTWYRASAGANTVNQCSVKDVTGTYAVSCNGWFLISSVPNLLYLPQSYVGSETFPGDGTVSGSGTAVIGYDAWPVTINGTIAVNPDCTGSANNGDQIAVFDQAKRIVSITGSGQNVQICQAYRVSKQ